MKNQLKFTRIFTAAVCSLCFVSCADYDSGLLKVDESNGDFFGIGEPNVYKRVSGSDGSVGNSFDEMVNSMAQRGTPWHFNQSVEPVYLDDLLLDSNDNPMTPMTTTISVQKLSAPSLNQPVVQ